MTQKNIKSKLNFFRNPDKKKTQTDTHCSWYNSHHLILERKSTLSRHKLTHQSSLESDLHNYGILTDHLNTPTNQDVVPWKKRTPPNNSQRHNSYLQKFSSLTNQTEGSALTPSYRKNLSIMAPKLRETGSTICQTPKQMELKLQQSKVSEFKKIRLLGKGRFGSVFLVKYFYFEVGILRQVLSLR